MKSEAIFENIIEVPAGRDQSYWVKIERCQDPDDESREIEIQCARGGKAALEQWLSEDELDPRYKVTADRIRAALDMDTGEIDWEAFPTGRGVLEEFPWCVEFLGKLDGEVLESIARTHNQIRGLPEETTWDEQCLWQADSGYNFCINEVFDLNRDDMYLVDDCVYDTYEDYCVDPDCDCGEVKVLFAANIGEEELPWVGHVTVSKDGTLAFTQEDCSLELLENLWGKYSARFPLYRERHAKRYPLMRDFGVRLKAFREKRKWEKVGPNEPCPCGTGKKYKKCCFLKERR